MRPTGRALLCCSSTAYAPPVGHTAAAWHWQWHLPLGPSSVLRLQHKLFRISTLFSIFLHPRRSPASSCHSARPTQPRVYTPRLPAFHCFLCGYCSCVQLELVGLFVAVAAVLRVVSTRQAVPCWFVEAASCWPALWRSKARSSVLCWEQSLPFGAPARLASRLHCHWRHGLRLDRVHWPLVAQEVPMSLHRAKKRGAAHCTGRNSQYPHPNPSTPYPKHTLLQHPPPPMRTLTCLMHRVPRAAKA
jgi:hypothetical protein